MLVIYMSDIKSTKLTIREDKPTAIASSSHDANINAVGYNVLFVAQRDPKLGVEILKIYDKAHKVKKDDPFAPEEDFALFLDEITKLRRD
jgi:hypothetical protein